MLTKKRIRAFTLVELTVTIAVTSIMLVFLGTFLGFFSSQYQLNQYNDRNFNSAYLLENAIINIIDRNNYNFIEVKEKKETESFTEIFSIKNNDETTTYYFFEDSKLLSSNSNESSSIKSIVYKCDSTMQLFIERNIETELDLFTFRIMFEYNSSLKTFNNSLSFCKYIYTLSEVTI